MQIRVRNMNKILNEILIINYSIIFYPFVYSAKNYSPYNWIIYFEFLYNIYFIYYIYNVSKFLYDTFFKFFAIIIIESTNNSTRLHQCYIKIYIFKLLQSQRSIEVSLFYHYFPSYTQNYYIRINFANTLEPIKFSETGKKNDEKPRTVVGFLATIKLSSNDRFPSTNTITKKKFPKLHQQSKYQIERAVSKYVNCPIRLAHIWFCSFLLYEGGGGDK